MGFEVTEGKFHIKAGLAPGSHKYLAAKLNANFPGNAGAHGLPTIQGLIMLSAGDNGRPLAILQSGELTGIRTAAATALAAKYGALEGSSSLAVIGCGFQSRYQVAAILDIFAIEHVTVIDNNNDAANAFAAWASDNFPLEVGVASSIAEGVKDADIVVTVTTGTAPVLDAGMVKAGAFIAAVGADNPDKQELTPDIFNGAHIICDDTDQCAKGGDLAHAIRSGVVTKADVGATLAELAGGARPGHLSNDQIVIFDSTGTGVQDVAAAGAAYETALKSGVGVRMSMGD